MINITYELNNEVKQVLIENNNNSNLAISTIIDLFNKKEVKKLFVSKGDKND